MTALPGVEHDRLGRYELLLKMASGGMASLHLARIVGPEHFEKLLCIKQVHDHLTEEREFVEMFLDESRIAALIQHPNVATVFDMGRIEGKYFMALEYVHGHNMRELLAAARRLPDQLDWAYAARLCADVAAGLHAAHELRQKGGDSLGVVHRDVSHQNILLSYDGHVKVVDFGIAYARERISSTGVKVLKGKVAYMSPEQANQQPVDRRSDIFSLGIVLYEAMTLKRLFKCATEVETILRVRQGKVPPPTAIRADIPQELEKIALKALAMKPENRYQTAAELQHDLEKLLVSQGRVVGQQQLSELMDRLFHAQREEKDRRIELALENRPHPHLGSMVFSGKGDESLTMMPPVETMVSRVKRWGMVIGGGAVGAALVVILALVLFRGGGNKGRDAPQKAPAAPARAADARVARPMPAMSRRKEPQIDRVTLTFEVRPADARVKITFRGKTHDGPTFRAVVKWSEQSETVRVTAKGYEPQSLSVTPYESQKVLVPLTKKTKRPMRWGHMRPRKIPWKPLPK